MKAVLLISHGSRLKETEIEIRAFVDQLKQKSAIEIIEYAFLEVSQPTIPQGIDECVKQGANEIIVLLNFLNAGRHVDEDIPQIVKEAQEQHANVTFHITKPLGQHEGFIGLLLDMIKESE